MDVTQLNWIYLSILLFDPLMIANRVGLYVLSGKLIRADSSVKVTICAIFLFNSKSTLSIIFGYDTLYDMLKSKAQS